MQLEKTNKRYKCSSVRASDTQSIQRHRILQRNHRRVRRRNYRSSRRTPRHRNLSNQTKECRENIGGHRTIRADIQPQSTAQIYKCWIPTVGGPSVYSQPAEMSQLPAIRTRSQILPAATWNLWSMRRCTTHSKRMHAAGVLCQLQKPTCSMGSTLSSLSSGT